MLVQALCSVVTALFDVSRNGNLCSCRYCTMSGISHTPLCSVSIINRSGCGDRVSYLVSLVRSLTEGGNP